VTIRLFVAAFALAIPVPATATGPVALDNQVYVERVSRDASGKSRVALERADALAPGDRLVLVVNYRNLSPRAANRLVLTNPVPAAIRFDGTADPSALVSIDGGKSWGTLARLAVKEDTGRLRPARASDVTHVRWKLAKPLPAGGKGKLVYRAIVR
jgi:hypothetical protein